MKTKYIIISPARNESTLIHLTINSIIKQSILPREYIIVDDGSSDNTSEIVSGYLNEFPWIKLVNRANRGHSKYGSGVVDAFYFGLSHLTITNYDFIVKLDCDLSLDPFYFENILKEFYLDQNLGIASGQTYFLNCKKQLIWEDAPIDHTRGPSKIYRKECFESINGLVKSLGWDNIDEVSARMNGWRTRSYPEYKIIHYRALGSNGGFIKGNIRHGITDYITGYHIIFFLIKSLYRLFTRPYVIGSLASFYGFFKYYIFRRKRVVDQTFISYYRKEQIRKLLKKSFWLLYIEKYNILWRLVALFSFLVYYSGVLSIYLFFRKKVFRSQKFIVLTYHKINNEHGSNISVDPKQFKTQIDYLYRKFKIVSIDEILALGLTGKHIKPQCDYVSISFDDGYVDNYEHAYPILKEKDIPALIFLISNQLERPGMLHEIQIKEMLRNDIMIGSHTMNHHILTEIDFSEAILEISNSKTDLEKKFQTPINYFAFPKGKRKHFNDRLKSVIQSNNYKGCFTMINNTINISTNNMEIPRIGIRNYPLYVFKVRVSGLLESRTFMFIKNLLSIS